MDFKEIQNNFESALMYKDFSLALKLLQELEAYASGQMSLPAGISRDMLSLMVSQLKWIAFVNIEETECADLVKDALEAAFLIPDFSVEEMIGKRSNLIFLDRERVQFMSSILQALEASVMLLGKDKIMIAGRVYEPTVGNWIKDYLSSPSQAAQRTNIDEIKYFNQSPNTRKLAERDKQELVEIMRMYDLLKNSVVSATNLPVTEDIEKAFEGFNLYKILPGLDYEEYEREKQNSASPGLSAENSPSPYINNQRFRPVSSPDLKLPVSKPAPVAVREPVSTPPVLPVRQVASLTDIKAEIESKKRKAQEEIDRKLEELKRKVQK